MTLSRSEAIELATKLLTRLRVYGPKLAVVRDEDEGIGGLVMPDQAKRHLLSGRVIALGSGIDNEDPNHILFGMEVGEHIWFTKYNPTLLTIDIDAEKVDYLVMHASDVHIGIRDQ